MKTRIPFAIVFTIMLLTTGCLYPNAQRGENQIPIEQNVKAVQQAVEDYMKSKHVLPIKTKEGWTQLYQKYPVDFAKLLPYLNRIPANAYEEGGTHLFVIVDPENEPKVKLFDLSASQKVGELQKQIFQHLGKHGELPIGEVVYETFHTIDFAKMNMDPITVTSPYSRTTLPLVIDSSTGFIGIDYAVDIGMTLHNLGIDKVDPETDLRQLLIDHSFFVPADSFPYRWKDGEPRLSKK